MFGKNKNLGRPAVYINGCEQYCKEGKLPGERMCPKWVILNMNYKNKETGEITVRPEGKCAMAWIPSLLVELKEVLQKKE